VHGIVAWIAADQTGNDQETTEKQEETRPQSDARPPNFRHGGIAKYRTFRQRNPRRTSKKRLLVTKSNEEKRIATTKKRASNYQIINKLATSPLQNGNKQPATRQQTPDKAKCKARMLGHFTSESTQTACDTTAIWLAGRPKWTTDLRQNPGSWALFVPRQPCVLQHITLTNPGKVDCK
jgi:hypothetical protein